MADLDPCPYCGRDDFGNAGGRAQHVRACKEDASDTQPDTEAAQTRPQPPQTRDDQPPAEDPSALAAAGENMASGLSATLDEDASLGTRKEGVKNLTSLAGGLLNGVMDYRERKKQREEQNARSADVEPVEDKPKCANCNLTFSKIPANAERISCPQCGAEYRVV